jgi:hypothetical protein
VLRHAEDLAFVLPDQLLICGCIPRLGARYERYVRVDLFRRWRLDGRHEQKVRKTDTEIVAAKRNESVASPV